MKFFAWVALDGWVWMASMMTDVVVSNQVLGRGQKQFCLFEDC